MEKWVNHGLMPKTGDGTTACVSRPTVRMKSWEITVKWMTAWNDRGDSAALKDGLDQDETGVQTGAGETHG